MLNKGSYIVYRGHGVCRITDIRKMDFEHKGEPQDYWVITPIAAGGTTIYLPANSEKALSKARSVLTKEKIDAILADVKQSKLPWIPDRKLRAAQFQEILARKDTREILLLASCLYRQNMQQKLSPSDQELLRKAEEIIVQEFSFALQLDPGAIGEYILQRL